MSSIQITLPDGSVQSVPPGSRPIDVARSISPRLADDAVVARVNGELYDLTRPLEVGRNAADPYDKEAPTEALTSTGTPLRICLPAAV